MIAVRTHTVVPTPLGALFVQGNGTHVVGIHFEGQKYFPDALTLGERHNTCPVLAEARAQLEAYFEGRLRAFDLPLHPVGTAFQRRVWKALLGIPQGALTNYASIASLAGSPGAARATGAAIGRNPISIVIPCHRVVGSGGSLTGYAGGLNRKAALLAIEHQPSQNAKETRTTQE